MARSKGVGVANWLVSKTSGLLDSRLNRRSFIARATLVGTAVAATGCHVVTRPGAPYTRITDCPPGALCRDGYTEFCCVINQGINACPPNTISAGWWRADYSVYCNGTRYYIDCNEVCCGPRRGDGFCAGCQPCRCGAGCNTRKVHCNYFRYGQCNQHASVGPIACRMVTCVPPYNLNIGCSPSGAVDNSTANHFTDCNKYKPPPPPPPLPALLAVGSAVSDGAGSLRVAVRGADGAAWTTRWDGTTFEPWEALGASVASRVAVALSGTSTFVAAKDPARKLIWSMHDGSAWSAWQPFEGEIASDPMLVNAGSAVVAAARGINGVMHIRNWVGTQWGPWIGTSGTVSSDPGVTTLGPNAMLAARGTNGIPHHGVLDGTAFGGWTGLSGVISTDPVLIPKGSGALLVARGLNNTMFAHGIGTTPAGWEVLPTITATSEPAGCMVGTEAHVFVRGNDNALWWMRGDTGAWSAWTSLGLDVRSSPVAVFDGAIVTVLVMGSDSALWFRRWDGATWTEWTTVPGLTIAPAKGYA